MIVKDFYFDRDEVKDCGCGGGTKLTVKKFFARNGKIGVAVYFVLETKAFWSADQFVYINAFEGYLKETRKIDEAVAKKFCADSGFTWPQNF